MMVDFLSKQMAKALEGKQKWISYNHKIEEINRQIREVENQIIHYECAYEKELRDVNKLEEGKLSGLVLKVLGKYDKAIEKETLEAETAKLRLVQKKDELGALKETRETLMKERMPYQNCEAEYKVLYKEKVQSLESGKGAAKIKYLALQEAIKEYETNIKEIKEAVAAGKRVVEALGDVAKSLDKAKDWGTWDLLGGGMISDLAKHSHLDDAKQHVQRAQRLIGAFRTELADIHMTLQVNINTDGFAKFADFFFDGIFADLYMQDRISESQNSVASSSVSVQKMCSKLEQLLREEQQKVGGKKYELERLIISGE